MVLFRLSVGIFPFDERCDVSDQESVCSFYLIGPVAVFWQLFHDRGRSEAEKSLTQKSLVKCNGFRGICRGVPQIKFPSFVMAVERGEHSRTTDRCLLHFPCWRTTAATLLCPFSS